ncbi:MAG: pantoate--beta-alanine ligase [Phycisphaerales bacterium]|nr:pantoate--beta-alanine ligase [Phycisphaerales bacterium]
MTGSWRTTLRKGHRPPRGVESNDCSREPSRGEPPPALTGHRDPANLRGVELIEHADALAPLSGGVLVPTMGALHAGHVALISAAVATGVRPVVVSIFVNPTQFAPGEDYERYPRTLQSDLAAAEAAGADAVFVPDVDDIYPAALPVPVPPLPAVATEPGLEDACRPGHFAGVTQVVARLFDLAGPIRAVFGEKDYQQLRVIEAMARAHPRRWQDLQIVPVPTVRADDGLALSSRNRYLDPPERDRALGVIRALRAAAETHPPELAESVMLAALRTHDLDVDYAVVRDASTLRPVTGSARPTRGLVAARVGSVRLIDNIARSVHT